MNKKPDHEARDQEAKKVLERVQRDAEVIGQSSLVRVADRARAHLRGDDADPDDKAELWGRRVGRALSLVAFVLLALWLINFLSR